MTAPDVGAIMGLIVVMGFIVWVFAGAPTTAKSRAREALRRRGICPIHFKPYKDQRAHREHPGWYSSLCEDCIPEWDETERERVKDLIRIAR